MRHSTESRALVIRLTAGRDDLCAAGCCVCIAASKLSVDLKVDGIRLSLHAAP